jgi:hypothetical protein
MEKNQQINIWVLYHILDDETHIWIQQSHYIWFVFMGEKMHKKNEVFGFQNQSEQGMHYNPNNLSISMLLHLGLHQLLVLTKQIPLR